MNVGIFGCGSTVILGEYEAINSIQGAKDCLVGRVSRLIIDGAVEEGADYRLA
jgi:hypothetical protein